MEANPERTEVWLRSQAKLKMNEGIDMSCFQANSDMAFSKVSVMLGSLTGSAAEAWSPAAHTSNR